MTAQPLTAAEVSVVARFEAAAPAEESAVERVARALFEEAVSDLPESIRQAWEDIGDRRHAKYRRLATAALTAMRPAPDAPKTDEGAALRQRFIEAIGEADAHTGARTQGESESAEPFNRGFVMGLCVGASIAGMEEDVWASPQRHERQRAEYETHERQSLAQGRCPDSGGLLIRAADDGRLYCIGACDCFGYSLEEYQDKGGRS